MERRVVVFKNDKWQEVEFEGELIRLEYVRLYENSEVTLCAIVIKDDGRIVDAYADRVKILPKDK